MKIAVALFFAFCLTAAAEPMWIDGRVVMEWPTRIYNADGFPTDNPTRDDLIAAGHRPATAEELQADADALAVAQAQKSQYADPQPAVFLPRIIGSLTNIVGISQAFIDDATDELVAVDETGSPEHTQSQKQAQHDAQKTGKLSWSNLNLEVKASISNTVESAKAIARLTNNFTAAQNRTTINALIVNHEQLTKDVRELRRLLAKYAKEDDQ